MRSQARIELGDAALVAAVGRQRVPDRQEGLTNARKHAPEAAVTLTADVADGDLRIDVRSLAPVPSRPRRCPFKFRGRLARPGPGALGFGRR